MFNVYLWKAEVCFVRRAQNFSHEVSATVDSGAGASCQVDGKH